MGWKSKPEFQRGDSGQRLISEWLKHRGWLVIPSYDYTGATEKAPRMQGIQSSFVLPDIDLSKSGKRCWAEVKTKSSSTLHRKTGILEHGFALRHYRDYLRVEKESGCTVFLIVYELDTTEILSSSLSSLGKGRIYTGDKMDRGGTIFWPRTQFRIIGRITDNSP